MNMDFWKTKQGYWAIIAITYAAVLGLNALCSAFAGITEFTKTLYITVFFIFILAGIFMGWQPATKAINWINNTIINSVFGGNLFLFGPISMFFQIFLIKIVLRIVIAVVIGPLLFPYYVGKYIATNIVK